MYDWAKVGVLTASALAAAVGALILIPRNRMYARREQEPGAAADEIDRGAGWGADG